MEKNKKIKPTNYGIACGRIDGEEVFILKPMGYMNNSGKAVKQALKDLKIKIK